MSARWAATPWLLALALVAASCGGGGAQGDGRDRELLVSAAASLTDAFSELGQAFEAEQPGVRVRLNLGPSDGLATQIVEGAPVDVFASASPTWIDVVERDGPGVLERVVFARNRLAIVTPVDDPAGISEVEDLARDGVKLVLAAEGVPAGDYAREMLALAGIAEAALANVVSNEEDVRAVITKVLSGDADAGVVYATDVTPDVAARVRLVAIPDALNVLAGYTIAVVRGSREVDLATRFVELVLGERGRAVLTEHGFLPPG